MISIRAIAPTYGGGGQGCEGLGVCSLLVNLLNERGPPEAFMQAEIILIMVINILTRN